MDFNLDNVILDQIDLDSLQDTIFNALDINVSSPSSLQEYWKKLPVDIKLEAMKWGISDTPTRESIFEWLQENIKL